ncbi:MAG: ABC transporter substrate-binding protein [Proteobacteria bacterium]|nr:ABC transporter substrate-binding protein [Pseudomonadota bacterium]
MTATPTGLPARRARLARWVLALTMGFGTLAARAATDPAIPEPQQVMVEVSQRLFAALDAHRADIRRDPQAVLPLVDEIVLPHFDVDYATQLILAQHWRAATAEQRLHFVDAFYHALLRTYGGALADATADRLRILPFRGDPDAPQVTVRTEVTRQSGAVVPVEYRLHRTAGGWKAFDVVIEGISYVRNYRTDLDAEISARGLDAVIRRIEAQGVSVPRTEPRGP